MYQNASCECKNDMIDKVKPFMKDIQTKREKAKDMINNFTVDGKGLNDDRAIQFE